MSKRHWLLIALLLASRAWAQGDAASSAFAEGKALGAGTIDSAFQGIGNGTGAATVPGFGQRTPQSQVFQAGQGQLSGRVRPRSSTAPARRLTWIPIVGRSVTPSISWPAIRRYGRHSR
jgi:hypothetical protein